MPDIAANRPASGAPIESTWGGQVHDTIEGIQAGILNITTTAATTTDLALTFPRAFTAPPVLVAFAATGGNVYQVGTPNAHSATGATLRVYKRDGTAMTAGNVIPVQWIAVGTPA